MRVRGGVGAAMIVLLLLVGCAPAPDDDDDGRDPVETPDATPTSSTEPTEPAETPRTFRMPQKCAQLITAETATAFADAGLELLGGPEGRYGEHYFGDPTPEERAGGITCVWGDEADAASTVIVSVAPISTTTRSGIVSSLVASGLIESQIEGAISYSRIGDEVSAPGELHVIRNDSWVSVIEALGGEDRFQHATELIDEVTAQIYVAS